MAVKIRMTRMGRRHRPFFRINAVDGRAPRDGRVLEKLGHFDPLVKDRQFCDVGSQYRTAIFYHDEAQKKAAEKSRDELNKSGRFKQPIQTEIVAASTFYRAEEYHQDYYKKNPIRYVFYRNGCGRDGRLKSLWGDEADVH